MGNKSNTTATPAAPLNTTTSAPTTRTTTSTTLSAASTSTAASAPTAPTTTTTPAVVTTATTTTPAVVTTATTTTPATVTTPTPTTTTTTTAATTTTPTPTITPTVSVTKDIPKTPASTEGTPKPTFYSIAKSLTSDVDKAKSASIRWYKWSKFEQQKRDKGKLLWYMGPPVTTTDTPSLTTTILTMTTARINGDQKEASDPSNIAALPSFQLRSTAVYSPPHGDRIPPGRSALIDTDTSVFKYYLPDTRLKRPRGTHTKATMYKMDTHSKQTPLPNGPSRNITNPANYVIGDNSRPPTFVSRSLQTDFEVHPMNSSSTPVRYYEKQQSQIVPISAFSNDNSSHNGFFHLTSQDTSRQPVLPPIEKTPVWVNDQPHPSVTQSFPSYPPPPPPPRTRSILKNSSTVLSQDISNPLSDETHDKVLEELRKRNKNTKDGTYRIKKIHLLEKNDPPSVSFNLPPPPPPTKASQSISRSEKLFFSQLFNRKK